LPGSGHHEGVTQIVESGRHDVKQLTLACRVWDYLQRNNGIAGETHEDPTIGILVVQVRRIRAISGDVFQPPAAALVTLDVVPAKAGTHNHRVRYEVGCFNT